MIFTVGKMSAISNNKAHSAVSMAYEVVKLLPASARSTTITCDGLVPRPAGSQRLSSVKQL